MKNMKRDLTFGKNQTFIVEGHVSKKCCILVKKVSRYRYFVDNKQHIKLKQQVRKIMYKNISIPQKTKILNFGDFVCYNVVKVIRVAQFLVGYQGVVYGELYY